MRGDSNQSEFGLIATHEHCDFIGHEEVDGHVREGSAIGMIRSESAMRFTLVTIRFQI